MKKLLLALALLFRIFSFSQVGYSEMSSNLAAYNLLKISDNTLLSGTSWTDGIMCFNWRDSAIIVSGGCSVSAPSTDTVRISTDGGVTFSYKSKLPHAMHTVAHLAASDGYYYWFGGDAFGTSTQQKTVIRTNDFSTFTTKTSNAGYGSRVLEAAWEWNGALYVGGGMNGALTLNFNDIWKSTDGGATWSQWTAQAIASNGDSVMIGNAYNSVLVFNNALYRIMVNVYPADANKKCYKSLDGGLSWIRIDDYPYSAGASYPSSTVWDGKLWFFNGYSSSSNTSNLAYLDKSDTWHTYYNFSELSGSGVLTSTHAGESIVYKDQVLNVLGNSKNDVWKFFRSNIFQGHVIRDSTRWNYRTFVGESKDGLEAMVSNGGRVVPSTTQGMIKTTSDNASAVRLSYDNGITFQTGVSGSSGTTYLTTANERMRIDNNGKVVVGTGTTTGSLFEVHGTMGATGNTILGGDLNVTGSITTLDKLGVGTTSPSAQFHIFSGSTAAITKFENNNIAFTIGGDATEAYFQPFTSSRGVGFYNAAGTTYFQVLASGGFGFHGDARYYGAVGVGTAPAASAALDVSSTTQGILPPRMTSTQRDAISSLAEGLTIYNTTVHKLQVYDGSSWQSAW